MDIDPARTAVVVVDMVNWQVPKDVPEGAYWNQYYVDRCRELVVPAHQRLLPAARAAGARVVYLRVGASETDFSDVIRPFREGFRMYDARIDTAACEVIPEIAPQPGDVTLEKRGSGGFNTADLDSCLHSLGVDTVVYTGVVTNCCVLLTVSAGFDMEYQGYLAADATATFSDELQAAAELVMGSMTATVTQTDALIASLREARAGVSAGV
jgi:nicotinamidase-related amidase